MTAKPLLELTLRPSEAPSCASPGAKVYVLLPSLEDLLGAPGFGLWDAIQCGPGPYIRRLEARPRHLLH